MMILSIPINAQQPPDSFDECYNLTTEVHCFKTARQDQLKTLREAIDWCADREYALVKIESAEVQTAVEKFIEKFELTSDDVWTAANRTVQQQWTWLNGDVYGRPNKQIANIYHAV